MDRNKPIDLSLTSTNSHSIKVAAGQGSFSIGEIGMDKKKFDVLVEKDVPIYWNTFDPFTTPAGSHWPRFFYYYGNDIGFLEWSKNRAIEEFFWQPSKPVNIDLNTTQIGNFSVRSNKNPIKITLPEEDEYHYGLRSLSLLGDIEEIEIVSKNVKPHIRLYPNVKSNKSLSPYQLPVFNDLAEITLLDVAVDPLGQVLDCASLLQFPNLKSLNLTGNISNVNRLAELKKLESLAVRYTPNLENFPPLTTWGGLRSFIGWNIDATAGKKLKAELKLLMKSGRELEYSSVSKLRSMVWFMTEYGIPFANWESKNAKIATKAYKAAVQEIAQAKTVVEVERSIATLITIINQLPNIETVEREDTAVAIQQLIGASSVKIPMETADNWFDEMRDF